MSWGSSIQVGGAIDFKFSSFHCVFVLWILMVVKQVSFVTPKICMHAPIGVRLLISIVLGINIRLHKTTKWILLNFKENYFKILWQLSFDLNLKENNPINPSVWKAFQNWIGINSYNSYNVNRASLWGPCKKNHTLCLHLWGIKVEAMNKLYTYWNDDIVGFILWFTTITCWLFQWKNSRHFCF